MRMARMLESADERLPGGDGGRSLLLAVMLVAIILGGWELFWRSRGWTPTVEGNQESWILARGRIRPTSTVITGTSRIQGALDPATWSEVTGERAPIQLAVAGASPLPVLEDLAADSSFHGLVLAELMPFFTFDAKLAAEENTRTYLAAYRDAESGPAVRWEAWFRTHVPNHMVFRRTKLLPHRFSSAYKSNDLAPPHSYQRSDRYHPISFSDEYRRTVTPAMLDSSHFQNLRKRTTPATGAELQGLHARIRASIARIVAHGGRVVLIHLSACGGRRIVEDGLYPDAVYWEPLRTIPGITLIDSNDHPEIATLPCLDGSHIDARDAPMVTRLLAKLSGAALPAGAAAR